MGALVGAVAGHFLIDREADPGVAFTIAVIALAGKMAKADGVVSDDEFDAFHASSACRRRKRPMCGASSIWRARMWRAMKPMPARSRRLFMGNPAMLEDILDGLFEIAKGDGVLHPCESAFLEQVAEIFGFAPNEFRRIRASHFAPGLTDPYVILGVSYIANENEIRQTYRRLVRENHPDNLMARGVPEEFIKLANDKLAAINTAYDKIQASGA